MRLRVGVDATPLIGQRTGVGRYVQGLLTALAARGTVDVTATAFTARGRVDLRSAVPAGTATAARPAPARLLRASWARGGPPPVEWLCGRVDVFHGTNFVLPPRRRAAGVLTVHDLAFRHLPDTLDAANLVYRDLVPRGVRAAAVTLTPTEVVRQELLSDLRLAPERVVVTPLGVEDHWFSPPDAPVTDRDGRAVGAGPPYVLFVGSVEPRKGLPTLVEALRRCPPDHAPRLVLAGPAGWGTPLDTGRGLDVVRTGFLDDEQLRHLVAGAQAVALPSRYEGFGLPVLEALAMGTPVLASDLPVLREVGGTHVSFLPHDDPDAWAAALSSVVGAGPAHDPEPGRAWARRWTWDACAAATEAAYLGAASGG